MTKRKTTKARGRARVEAPTETPVVLRLPAELVKRVDALASAVMRDTATVALLGRVSRSALYRLVILEGLKALERRYARTDPY